MRLDLVVQHVRLVVELQALLAKLKHQHAEQDGGEEAEEEFEHRVAFRVSGLGFRVKGLESCFFPEARTPDPKPELKSLPPKAWRGGGASCWGGFCRCL